MNQGTSATDPVGAGNRRTTPFAPLARIVLGAVLLTACGEGNTAPVIGSISGTVTLEGSPLGGISVALSGQGQSASATTEAAGTYRFDDVVEGSYTITISGFPSDAQFEASMSVSISESTQNPTADFAGTYIRTAMVTGAVTVEGAPLSGISVARTGASDTSASSASSR